eukprot:6006417-Pyramimonas_sp.AAC.4
MEASSCPELRMRFHEGFRESSPAVLTCHHVWPDELTIPNRVVSSTGLARFLVMQQAAQPGAITILVPYTSQLFYIRMLMRGMDGVEGVTCSTVDQYQVPGYGLLV